MNKHKLNIHYRGSPWGSRTQQHAYCLRYAYSHHIESHFGKKQPQAKTAIAFLFGQLHFNTVTSHALFYGGHLVMRSKRCAMQNQGITLITFVNHLSGPLRKQMFTCDWCISIHFVSVFQSSLLVIALFRNVSGSDRLVFSVTYAAINFRPPCWCLSEA